jgi:pyruvate dehydrogenase E1 component alpha subunit
MKLTHLQLIEIYRRMARIRCFDEQVVELAAQGEIPGAVHTSIGQEGEIVGACMALEDDDYMVGNHRSHGHPIGKGAALPRLMAELFGKQGGVNRGKSGSMHLADFSVGSLGETSIVGSGIPIATGAALGAQMQRSNRVCLCFFGDGAANEGTFHEGLNLAALWKLPVIFLCENNGYAVTTPVHQTVAGSSIAGRAVAYAMPGVSVDGQDPLAVYEVAHAAVTRARAGHGPSLIEARTYRYREHAEGGRMETIAAQSQYRSQEELTHFKRRDPLALFRRYLIQQGVCNAEEIERIEHEIQCQVAEATAFARQCPYPDPSEAFTGVYTHLF